MSELIDSLDLARSCSLWERRYASPASELLYHDGWPIFGTFRNQFGVRSCLLRKTLGSWDDSFYERNLWPCRGSRCRAVLGPLDVIGGAGESHVEGERCCPLCGAFRYKVGFEDLLNLLYGI